MRRRGGQGTVWLRRLGVAVPAVLLAAFLSAAALAQSLPPASGTAALAHVTALSQQIGSRVAGTAAYGRAADYVAEQFQRLGYRVERQAFSFVAFEEISPPVLAVTAPTPGVLHPVTLLYSAPTPAEGLEAEVVAAGLGRKDDFDGKRLEGRIALVERGQVLFSEKAANATAAGAGALVIYDSQPGAAQVGTLSVPAAIPVVMIPQEEGRRLLQWLGAGPVRVRLTVASVISVRQSDNVLGIKIGTTAPEEVVVVGGHLDSVPGSPGANDNASGVATMLEAARLLAGVPTARTIHFVAFGGEEIGLVGSDFYVRNRRSPVVGMINLDMVGNGPALLLANSAGAGGLLEAAARAAGRLDIPVQRVRFGSSDHVSFERAGVPVVFIHTGDDGVYHTPMDTVSHISPQLLAQAAGVAAALAADLAASPPR